MWLLFVSKLPPSCGEESFTRSALIPVRLAPLPENAVAVTVPFTSSAVLGFVFPIPTLPSLLIRTLSAGGEPCASLVENAKSP